jgi:hypothetical protein
VTGPPAPTAHPVTEVVAVHPAPTPAVLTAIVAAVEEAWPRPVAADDTGGQPVSAWRFSGRWWSKPLPSRRDRPR